MSLPARPANCPRGLARINLADPQYDRAIDDLMKVLVERGRISIQTVQVMSATSRDRRSIAEARRRRARSVGRYLSRHLADQRRLKLALLREAKNLPRFEP
jgi:hypothetical protein